VGRKYSLVGVLVWALAIAGVLSVSAYGAGFNRSVLKNKAGLVFATRDRALGARILAITRKYPGRYTLLRYLPSVRSVPSFYGGMPFLQARQIVRELNVAGVLQPAVRGGVGVSDLSGGLDFTDETIAGIITTLSEVETQSTTVDEIVFSTVITNSTNSVNGETSTTATASTNSTNGETSISATNSDSSTSATTSETSTETTNGDNSTNTLNDTSGETSTNATNANGSRVWQNELNDIAAVLSQYNASVYQAYLLGTTGQVYLLSGRQVANPRR